MEKAIKKYVMHTELKDIQVNILSLKASLCQKPQHFHFQLSTHAEHYVSRKNNIRQKPSKNLTKSKRKSK